MAEILGIGCTHRPVMLRPERGLDLYDEGLARRSRHAGGDEEPGELAGEAARGTRQRLGRLDRGALSRGLPRSISPRRARALDEFKPDLIVMWGDDQYENFKEDIVPPFAVLGL